MNFSLKRSFNTWNYSHSPLKNDLFGIIRDAQKHGYRAMECSYNDLKTLAFNPEKLQKIGKEMTISALHVTKEGIEDPKTPEFLDLLNTKEVVIALWEPSITPAFTPIPTTEALTMPYQAIRNMDIFRVQNSDKIKTWVDTIHQHAERLHSQGFHLSYHNHIHEWLSTPDTASQMEMFCLYPHPHLGFQIDLGHALLAKADLDTFLSQEAKRIRSIHLKDFVLVTNSEGQVIQESQVNLGTGLVPFNTLMPKILSCPALQSLVVEIDPDFTLPSYDPADYLKNGYAFLERILDQKKAA